MHARKHSHTVWLLYFPSPIFPFPFFLSFYSLLSSLLSLSLFLSLSLLRVQAPPRAHLLPQLRVLQLPRLRGRLEDILPRGRHAQPRALPRLSLRELRRGRLHLCAPRARALRGGFCREARGRDL